MCLLTNEYDTTAPAAVAGLAGSSGHLNWSRNTEGDLCYYRIYRGANSSFSPAASNEIGSTVATYFDDTGYTAGTYYAVTAVDKYGNESALARPTVATNVYEAENLQIVDSSADTIRLLTEPAASGGACVILDGNAAGD